MQKLVLESKLQLQYKQIKHDPIKLRISLNGCLYTSLVVYGFRFCLERARLSSSSLSSSVKSMHSTEMITQLITKLHIHV